MQPYSRVNNPTFQPQQPPIVKVSSTNQVPSHQYRTGTQNSGFKDQQKFILDSKSYREEPMKRNDLYEEEGEIGEYVFPDPHVKYKIMPAEDDKKVLDVTSLDNADKQLIQGHLIIWEYHGGPNQHFYINKVGQKQYFLINVSTGFVVEIPQGSTDNEVQAHTIPKNGTQNEVWELVNCGKNLYKIRSFCGKLLDVSGAWIKDGAKVIQYDDHDGKNQKWKIWPA